MAQTTPSRFTTVAHMWKLRPLVSAATALDAEVRLYDRLSRLPPGDGWGAFLSNSGAEAVEAAIKLARIATGLRLRPMAEPLTVSVDAQTPARILAPKTISSPAISNARSSASAA